MFLALYCTNTIFTLLLTLTEGHHFKAQKACRSKHNPEPSDYSMNVNLWVFYSKQRLSAMSVFDLILNIESFSVIVTLIILDFIVLLWSSGTWACLLDRLLTNRYYLNTFAKTDVSTWISWKDDCHIDYTIDLLYNYYMIFHTFHNPRPQILDNTVAALSSGFESMRQVWILSTKLRDLAALLIALLRQHFQTCATC